MRLSGYNGLSISSIPHGQVDRFCEVVKGHASATVDPALVSRPAVPALGRGAQTPSSPPIAQLADPAGSKRLNQIRSILATLL
jgi:hypothetical protein